ncbi:enolase-phosphatase E1-like [Haliotis asinina]|uniref:enolase-phosphatase E1-like n=1 Tax=Haliotis asinina TaxID=109174 RepID=UPI0035321163
MQSRSSMVVVLWLAVLCCDVGGFSIKRRESPSTDLSEAFRVLERQRRRIREEDYLAASRLPEPRVQLSPSDLEDWGQGVPSREEEWLQDAYGLSPYDEDSYAVPELVDESNQSNEGPLPEKVETSKEELQSIFGDSDKDAEEEDSANEGQDSGKEIAATSESEEKGNELDNLTEDEFKALMSAVEKLQKRALSKKDIKNSAVKVPTTDPVPVSKEELNEVFDDSQDDSQPDSDAVADEVSDVAIGEAVPSKDEELQEVNDQVANEGEKDPLTSIENYWLLKDYFNGDEKRKKRFTKRAPIAKPPNSVPLEETYMKEIQTLRDEIQQLKMVSELEDLENDALTQTLNEATLSQMEGTVSDKEFGSLEQAIKLEEALQDLKNGKVDPLIVELIAANALGEKDGMKRGEPVWKKKKRMDEADLEQSYPMFPSDKRAAKRMLMLPSNKRSLKRVQEEEVNHWYDRPIEEEEEAEEEQRYLDAQDAIDAMVGRLAESEQNDFTDDDIESEGNYNRMAMAPYYKNTDKRVATYQDSTPPDSGVCPSDGLLTNCKFADLQGLPIDEEARELCNRHEMCYTCGATTHVKQGECDSLYRADAEALCDDDGDCVIEAELFLRELKLKHRYSTYYEPACDNSCTAEYIGL